LQFELKTWSSYTQAVSAAPQKIDARTRFCAVYGHPIAHSASPAMQNAGIAALGLNWRYLAFDVHPDDLRSAILGAGVMRFLGLNLTVPHKILAFDIVDHHDDSAAKWQAVNTIRFEALDSTGAWKPLSQVPVESIGKVRTVGFNTDAEALIRALREDLSLEPRGASVLLLGAGGAGQTAALVLAEAGVARLFLVNRTQAKALDLRQRIQSSFPAVAVSAGYPDGPVDLIVNATSLGLQAKDPLPLDPAKFSIAQATAVYDMVYRPAETPLLKHARAAGCRVANGLGMLLYQGARALEIWTGQTAPLDAMRAALRDEVYGR
jgi:shikimate dehydrogenase